MDEQDALGAGPGEVRASSGKLITVRSGKRARRHAMTMPRRMNRTHVSPARGCGRFPAGRETRPYRPNILAKKQPGLIPMAAG